MAAVAVEGDAKPKPKCTKKCRLIIGITVFLILSCGTVVALRFVYPALFPSWLGGTNFLCDIKKFSHGSDRFIVDIADVQGRQPYYGVDSPFPHSGGHVSFYNDRYNITVSPVESYPPIYAPAGMKINRIDTYFQVGSGVNAHRRYGISAAIAKSGGKEIALEYSIEPFVDTGDPDFYKQFILVKAGDIVNKGDVIAYMYLPPEEVTTSSHIHYSSRNIDREFAAADFFTQTIVNQLFGSEFPSTEAAGRCIGVNVTAAENIIEGSASGCIPGDRSSFSATDIDSECNNYS